MDTTIADSISRIIINNIIPETPFWREIINIGIPALAVLVGAYLAFRFGLKKERMISHEKEKKRLTEIKEYLLHSLNNLIHANETQIDSLQKWISYIKDIDNDIPKLELSPGFHTRNLNAISHYDLFRIILYKPTMESNKKRQVLNFFNNSIEVISNIEDQIKGESTILFNSERQQRETFNKMYFEFQKVVNRGIELLTNSKNQINQIELQEIRQVLDRFLKIENYNRYISNYNYQLVTPMIEVAKKYRDADLLFELQLMKKILVDLEFNRKVISERFEQFVTDIEKINLDIKKTLKLL